LAAEVSVNIATLSIGDELVFGEIVDTNASFIAQRLYDIGLRVRRHLAVGDAEGDIVEALLTLATASDVVIVTGGLGPTADDVTARAAAVATGGHLVLNEEALAHLRSFGEKLGRMLHPANEKQTFLPDKATVIRNPTGTACGFRLRHLDCLLFFLPGVPGEMVRMLAETVIPEIREQCREQKVIRSGILKVFGPSEAEVDALLQGMTEPGGPVTVAFRVVFPEILVKLRAEGDDEQQVATALDQARQKARERLQRHVYAEDEETMDSELAHLLRARGVTLSLAESCTGGLLAKRITDIAGSSAYFLDGAVTYANAAKTRLLGVSPRLIEEKGAVSAEVAMAMAAGMRERSGSDIALAVTGIAGPEGGSAEKPVGTVFIALADHSGCQAKSFRFFGNREEIRTITAFTALDWLRRRLILR
jgi:nicotinamide-nucleotide amidase